ncbi:MAG: FkbM family methyltransferase [Ignavibacteriales bacterium]|nr:MAG: FkbM family methyltransferase [Ignavibacteriales bacterium]
MPVSVTDKIKILAELFTKPKTMSALLSQKYSGFLKDSGWFNAFESGKPIDGEGNPLPWLTYSFIDFLTPRLNNQISVFEYGAGNSTLYFAKNVSKVIAVEHSNSWHEKISKMVPANTSILFQSESNKKEYISSVLNAGIKFNIVLVDAIFRVECLETSISALENDGIIILDDSERKEYFTGIDLLLRQGFRKLDFWGISPGYLYKKCTTVFYKNNNCLNI